MSNRLRKLQWNSTLALCYQFILIVTGLVLPRCFLHFYGSEVNGLVSSITQFLSFINICDMGISTVVSSAYYKPLADRDTHKVSQIFVYAKRYFRIISYILIGYVAVLLFVYPTFVNTSFSFGFTFALIAAMSISQFGQYFIGINYQLLLTSDQRSYVQLIINGGTLIANTVISVLIMYLGASIQVVKLTTSLIYLLRPILMYLYVKRHYTIDSSVPVDGSVVKQKKNGVIQHIAYIIYENTNVMVLTVFATLKDVSVYSVYVLVTNSIRQIINAATTGVQALFGNMIANNESKKLKQSFSFYHWIVHTASTVLFSITGLMIVPFVRIYTANITDANYHAPVFAALLTVAAYLSSIRNSNYVLIRSAGHYKQTQTASLVEAFLSLVISVFAVRRFGLVGVTAGTIAATAFFVICEIVYFSKNIVSIKVSHFVKQFVVDGLCAITFVLATLGINIFDGSIATWIAQAVVLSVICVAISLTLQVIFYRENLLVLIRKTLGRIKR